MAQRLLEIVFETSDGRIHKERVRIDGDIPMVVARAKKWIKFCYGEDTIVCDWYEI